MHSRGIPNQLNNWDYRVCQTLSRTEVSATGDIPRKDNVNGALLPLSDAMESRNESLWLKADEYGPRNVD